jgi:hypothetical protein
MSKRSRSDAAKLGWKRRRQREAVARREAKRRSDAARRGWETRRETRRRERESKEAPPKRRPPIDDGGVVDDGAFEWEIGFEYRAGDRNQYVDVNVRIRREDGAKMGKREAQRVFERIRDELSPGSDPIPSGYLMSYIDWRRPKWSAETWRGGESGGLYDLLAFSNPMYVEKDNDAAWSGPTPRYGSVK